MADRENVIAVLLPERTRRIVLDDGAEAKLNGLGTVRWPRDGSSLTAAEINGLLEGASYCLTGWGTPAFDSALRARHGELSLIAHSAGSIRTLVPAKLFEDGVRVTHAASMIAASVAEFVVAAALMSMRGIHRLDRGLRSGALWREALADVPQRLLGSKTVGIVGGGYVGRTVMRLLVPFGCRVLVADPLMSERAAAGLGVTLRGLDDLLAESDIVSLHAPDLPETRRMIGARELSLLRAGALLINTARPGLVDEAALLAELRSGRIEAILDVFETEPLPADSPFRDPALLNLTISPHAAGHTDEGHFRQGRAMVDEIDRHLRGEPLRHEVFATMLSTMA